MPAVPSYLESVLYGDNERDSATYQVRTLCLPRGSLRQVSMLHAQRRVFTSPQPLQGKATSSASYGDSGIAYPASTAAAAMLAVTVQLCSETTQLLQPQKRRPELCARFTFTDRLMCCQTCECCRTVECVSVVKCSLRPNLRLSKLSG